MFYKIPCYRHCFNHVYGINFTNYIICIQSEYILVRSLAVYYNRRAYMVSYKTRQASMPEASRAYIRERAEQSPLTATPNGRTWWRSGHRTYYWGMVHRLRGRTAGGCLRPAVYIRPCHSNAGHNSITMYMRMKGTNFNIFFLLKTKLIEFKSQNDVAYRPNNFERKFLPVYYFGYEVKFTWPFSLSDDNLHGLMWDRKKPVFSVATNWDADFFHLATAMGRAPPTFRYKYIC